MIILPNNFCVFTYYLCKLNILIVSCIVVDFELALWDIYVAKLYSKQRMGRSLYIIFLASFYCKMFHILVDFLKSFIYHLLQQIYVWFITVHFVFVTM